MLHGSLPSKNRQAAPAKKMIAPVKPIVNILYYNFLECTRYGRRKMNRIRIFRIEKQLFSFIFSCFSQISALF